MLEVFQEIVFRNKFGYGTQFLSCLLAVSPALLVSLSNNNIIFHSFIIRNLIVAVRHRPLIRAQEMRLLLCVL